MITVVQYRGPKYWVGDSNVHWDSDGVQIALDYDRHVNFLSPISTTVRHQFDWFRDAIGVACLGKQLLGLGRIIFEVFLSARAALVLFFFGSMFEKRGFGGFGSVNLSRVLRYVSRFVNYVGVENLAFLCLSMHSCEFA